MLPSIVIEAVTPSVDCGRYPVKRVVGDACIVEADIFRDGPSALGAAIKWKRKRDKTYSESPMAPLENDRWRGEFRIEEMTRYTFTIEAWTRSFASWREYFVKKASSGLDVESNLREGIELLERITARATGSERAKLAKYVQTLEALSDPRDAVQTISLPELIDLAESNDQRVGLTRYEPVIEVAVERPRARFGAWYEMFPRSQGTVPGKPSTFREAERRIADVRDLGFDVIYLPPIHPIGVTHRKGKNNSLVADPDSPGSPWAIGNRHGGHTAVDPCLGTIDDFDHFVATANRVGVEVALDFAVQCSPDHPWVTEHPEWFHHRPDGSIKYAENPPKQYQDIYPINFESPDQRGLTEELLRVVSFWADHGVHIFRVDNPHTKPVAFWEWLIGEMKCRHPDVLFLAEAFTRPKMMKVLAKSGFTQSYTYFTWRNSKSELIDYMTELTTPPMRDFFLPNFFTNTPDILPPILQQGGRPAFKMRLVLAATLSPSYGIYSGYELCENEAIPGTEEYLNSEKYEIKVRDWNRPGNIKESIARLNAIRRDNQALQLLSNLTFVETDNDQLLAYAKSTPDRSNVILVVVNLDPFSPQIGSATVRPEVVGVSPGQSYGVTDLLTGARYTWSDRNYIRLDPQVEPAHVFRVEVNR